MIEVKGNLWTYPADIKVITTNLSVRRDGRAVMGRGCALEAAQRWPTIARTLGQHNKLVQRGNFPFGAPKAFCLSMNPANEGWDLWAFHVKHEWHQRASLQLIAEAARDLARAWDGKTKTIDHEPDGTRITQDITVVLPRPGCGNGQRDWETEVKPILEEILTEDRYHVITF